MRGISRVGAGDVAVLRDLLRTADLTLSGLDAPGVRLWLLRDDEGQVVGSTSYEPSADGRHALVRSVAVAADHRGSGWGGRLARFALEQAAADGVGEAWLFSRRSGPFWQRLGFEPASREALASVLASTCQVQWFRQTGQLEREVAWWRSLEPAPRATAGAS